MHAAIVSVQYKGICMPSNRTSYPATRLIFQSVSKLQYASVFRAAKFGGGEGGGGAGKD